MSERRLRGLSWRVLAPWLALFLLTVTLHFWDLPTRSFHHDEAIHAKLSWNLAETGSYRYDPTYHGPLLYYVVAATYHLLGDSDFTARLPIALAGIGMFFVAWFLRRPFGGRAAWWTGLLFTISPLFLFYGRFLRMDLLEAVTASAALLAFYGALRGHSRAWVWLGIWAGLAFATKENAYVTSALLGLCAVLLALDVGPKHALTGTFSWLQREWAGISVSVAVFILVTVPMYTVGFTKPGDWMFPVKAISFWWDQHKVQRVGGPWWFHLPRLAQYEFLILIAATIWVVRRWKRLKSIELFLYMFGVTSIMMYIYLGEKVPWLGVHQVWPFVPLAGAQLARTFGPRGRWWSRSLAAAGLAATLVVSFNANFVLDEISPHQERVESLHFVQTAPELVAVAHEIRAIEVPEGSFAAAVHGEPVWPLTWYLRNHSVWWTKLERGLRPPIVVCDPAEEREVRTLLGPGYRRELIPLRSWWLMYEGDPSPTESLRYLFTRVPWSGVGSTDAVVLRRDNEAHAGRDEADTPVALAKRLGVVRSVIIGDGWHGEVRGIALHEGQTAVADTSLSRVLLYEAEEGNPREVVVKGGVYEPEDLAFTSDGLLVVADTWNHRVVKLDPSGGLVRILPVPEGGWYGPRSVAVGHDDRIAVADTGHKQVVILTAGGLVETILDGAEAGGLDEPSGLAWLDGDSVLVCDTGNRRLLVLGTDGSVVREVALPDAWDDYYSRPQAVVLGPDRWLVSDTPGKALWLIEGDQVERLDVGPGLQPSGLAVDDSGTVLLIGDFGGRLWRLEMEHEPT